MPCSHKQVVAVPREDDPAQMILLCTQCHAIIDSWGPGGLDEIGHSLGDPDEFV